MLTLNSRFWGLSDLRLGGRKVTWKKLAGDKCHRRVRKQKNLLYQVQAWEEDQVYLSSHLNYPLAYTHIAGTKINLLKMYFHVCPNFVAKHWLPGTLLLKSSPTNRPPLVEKKTCQPFFNWLSSIQEATFSTAHHQFQISQVCIQCSNLIFHFLRCRLGKRRDFRRILRIHILWIHRKLAIFTKTAQETAEFVGANYNFSTYSWYENIPLSSGSLWFLSTVPAGITWTTKWSLQFHENVTSTPFFNTLEKWLSMLHCF